MLLRPTVGGDRRCGADGHGAKPGIVQNHDLAVGVGHDVRERELDFRSTGRGGLPLARTPIVPSEIDHGLG